MLCQHRIFIHHVCRGRHESRAAAAARLPGVVLLLGPALGAGLLADVGVVGEEVVHPGVEERLDLAGQVAHRVRVGALRYCSGRNWFSRRKVQPVIGARPRARRG